MEDIKQRLWSTEVEILDVFHEVCMRNGLRYSLAYGTLIGAVRHKGFIPWDDDIDVLMPREDYEKLLHVWDVDPNRGFILQEPYTSPDLVVNFGKIRKDHTAFIQAEFEREKKYHKGVFIDVFPLDRVAPSRFSRMIQRFFCKLVMLYNRGYTSGNGGVSGLAEKLLLAIVPKNYYRTIQRWAEKHATRWNDNTNQQWFGFQTVSDMAHFYAPNVFDNLIELEFEGKYYLAFKDYDKVLRDEFGDYMQLPPEEERTWKHQHVLIDLEHNYEELAER